MPKPERVAGPFQALFDSTGEGVAIYEAVDDGADFVFVDWNAAGQAMDGKTLDEVKGRRVTEAFPGVREFGLLDVLTEVWRTKEVARLPLRLYRDHRLVASRSNTVVPLPSGRVMAIYSDSTALARAELRLKEGAELLADSPVVGFLWGVGDSWTTDGVSGDVQRLLGCTDTDLLQQRVRFLDYVHPDDVDRLRAQVQRCIDHSGQRGVRLDPYRLVRDDGAVRWVEHRVVACRDLGGDVVQHQGLLHDVTEARASRQALVRDRERLRESEELFSKAFHENPTAMQIFNVVTGQQLDVNAAAIELFQRSRSWFEEGNVLTDDSRWEDPVAQRVALALLRERGSIDDLPLLAKHPSGEPRSLLVTASLLDIRDGELAIAAYRDVTERQRAEAALQTERERLEALFSSAPDYVLLLDEQLQVELVNRIEDGVAPEALLGQPLWRLVIPEDQGRVREELERVLERGVTVRYTTTFRRPDGSALLLSTVAAPLRSSGQIAGVVVNARDITEKVRLAQERDDLERQVREAQKMEAVGRLAGGIAHDFNNMLAAIIGNVELSLLDLEEGDPAVEALEEINEAAGRAARLTRQLLTFSRKQVIEPHTVDLGELVHGMLTMLRRVIGEHIRIDQDIDPDLDRVHVDRGQIEQAVLNLAINARDAMPEGGVLTITCENHAVEPPVLIDLAAPDEFVCLKVSDTGVGMTPEVRERIFEPFFTTKEVGQGTGLGLATVFGVVEQNGGRIEVDSTLGVGSTFRLLFPVCEGPGDSLNRSPVASGPVTGEGTLLVVEDEDDVRRLTVRQLRRLGYSVIEAPSGDVALELAARYQGEIKVLITDVVMPGISGVELVQRLRALRPGMRALFTSGYAPELVATHGLIDGEVEFLAKPFRIGVLAERVRELVG